LPSPSSPHAEQRRGRGARHRRQSNALRDGGGRGWGQEGEGIEGVRFPPYLGPGWSREVGTQRRAVVGASGYGGGTEGLERGWWAAVELVGWRAARGPLL